MGVKQVIVIRKDLKMRRGKEIAQGAHASIAFLTRRLTAQANYPSYSGGYLYQAVLSKEEESWIKGLFAKITLQVNSEEELREVYNKAKAAGLEAHLIIDSGLTEFDGVPTATTVGIGPHEDEKFIGITDHLKLY